MRTWLRVAAAVARRELLCVVLSPRSYLVAALFLLAHGYAFWLLCQALAASRAPASAVVAYFFGGTFLYWLILLFAAALLSMRLFADERQRGSLDQLLATAAPESAIVVGKFGGALAYYCGLWLPTVAHLALLGWAVGDASALDRGAILGGYLGTLLCGSSALAIGLLASVLAKNALVAATLTLVGESLLLFCGLAADLAVEQPRLQALLRYLNPFQHLDELGRGIVDSRRVLYHLSLVATALAAATLVLRTRPGDHRRWRRNAGAGLGLALLLVAGNLVASRYPLRADLTRHGEHRLSPALAQLLKTLPQQPAIRITVLPNFAGATDGRDELSFRLHELLRRAEQAAGGRLQLDRLDPRAQPERSRLLAERLRLRPDELLLLAMVVEFGDRQHLVPSRELEGESSSGERHFTGEAALGTALHAVTSERRPTLCYSRGHGEADPQDRGSSGLSELDAAFARDGLQRRSLEDPGELGAIPSACDLLFIAGPARPFLPSEAAAIGSYLEGGGRLLLLSGALLDRGLSRFLDSGLESLLLERGVRLPHAVAVDPSQQLGQSLAFVVSDGYGDHPAVSGLAGQRTLWPLPRPVLPLAPLEPPGERTSLLPLPPGTGHSGLSWRAWVLAATTAQGFGETDLATLRDGQPHFDRDQDLGGPLPLGVAAQPRDPEQRARLVVLGSNQLAWNDSLVLYNRDLVLATVKWLVELPPGPSLAPRPLPELRLLVAPPTLERLGLGLLLGLPLLALLLGAAVGWRRREPRVPLSR